MAKLKDGFYKLTASSIGSDLLVLLAGGGAKPISDFAQFNNAYWANIPISNTSSTTTNPTFANIIINGTLSVTGTGTFNSQIISNVADGTAPLVITSTSRVDNLNADAVDGFHMRQWFTNASDITNTAMFWQASGSCSDVSSMGYAALINVIGDTGRRWQIWNSRGDHLLYWRPEKSDMSDWADVHTLIDDKNISNYLPTVTDYYWANVPVSSTSNDKTTPTFANTTVNGIVTVNGPQNALTINSSGKSAYTLFIKMINPNMSTTYHTSLLAFGYDQTAYNVGYIGFKFVAKDSKSNMITLGLHSVDHVLNITGNGFVGIGTEAPTASLSVNGHVHIGNSSGVLSSPWKSGIVIGPDGTDKIVATYLASATNGATIGAHNSALTAWAPLHLGGTKFHFRVNESLKMELTNSGQLAILKTGASTNSGLVVGADSTKSNISTAIADLTAMIQIVAGSGGATNSSAIGFHNPGISSAVLEYKNASADLGYFNFRSDDKTWNVGIGTITPSYKLHVEGDTYTSGWSRAGNGFYVDGKGVHYMSNNANGIGQIYLSNNNEFNWSASAATLYFNYRASANGTTVTSYVWNAGSSSSYASHSLGNLYIQTATLSTTLPTYDNAPLKFNATANNNNASNSRYQPWISGMNSVNSYGYGVTVSTGIYRDPGYSSGGYYIGCGWDGNANSVMWKFSRNGYLYGNFSGYLSGTAYSADAIKDSSNGTRITACYSTGGFSSNPSWLAAWNGYHLTYVSPGVLSVNYANSAGNADTVDSLHASDFVRAYGTYGTSYSYDSDWGLSIVTFDPIVSGTAPAQNPNISILNIGNNYARRKQLAFTYSTNDIYYRRRTDSSWSGWIRLAISGESYTKSESDSRYVNVTGDTMTGNLTVPSLFINTGDPTLKIYSGRVTDAKSDGNICLQTCIDGLDGQTHSHAPNHPARENLVLLPRGGQVYIGTNPDGGNTSYKLYVNGKVYSTGYIKSGSSDSYVLLGGGGHKAESSLSVSYASSAGNADTVNNLSTSSFYVQGRGSVNAQVDIQTIPKDTSGGWMVTNSGWTGMVAVLGQGHCASNRAIGFLFKGGQSSRINLLTQVDNTWGDRGVIAYTSDIPTTMAWNSITGKPSTFTPSSHTHDDRYYTESEADSRFINASGDTMTGLLTVTTSSSHGGIKMGDTYVTSINGSVIFQNNDAIRFGSDSWDWNVWAGLKYNHSNKTIYLGLADNSIFTANAALSGGSLRFPGISKAWINTSEGNEVLNLGGWLGTVGNTGWYSVTHKGGWYMIDGSYVRTYNNVRIHTGSLLRDAFNSAGGYYSSWNNSVGNDWTSILNTANAVFSKDNLYVNHGTALPMMTWANTVNSYGYVTRYSIGSVRPTNGAWGILRLCVGNNDAGTSCGCYMDLDGDGSITTNASMYAAHFYENSDILLKLNIQEILNSDKMPIIKEFDWKEDGSHSYGLIAQELEEQGYSELVSTKDDGYKTVNYSAALSLIVGKLQVKIKELEEEIEILKNKN